jgi:peroxin-10
MSYMEWIVLMVYLLGWNKHLTILETLLGINYAYTYKNDQIHDASYAMEGYVLLATFLYKVVKQVVSLVQKYKQRKNQLARQNTIGVPLEKSKLNKKAQPNAFKKINKVETVGGLKPKASEEAPRLKREGRSRESCRICYGEMENRSATSCGHVFCWGCITKTLEMSPECPVCRSSCLPREVIQLRNF